MNLIFGQINNRLSVITHKSPFAPSCTAGKRRQCNCRPNLWVITNRLSLFIFGE